MSDTETNRGAIGLSIGIFLIVTLVIAYVDQKFVPPGIYQGFLTIIGSFIVVMTITRFRGETLADMGLRRPKRYWTLPLWVIAIFVVTYAVAGGGQLVVLQFVDAPPDLSKFAVLHNNLPVLIISLVSIWVTAAFFEEVVYRGFLLRNLLRLAGGGGMAVFTMSLLHAIPFGILHLYQGLLGVITTGLVAVVFGIFYALQGRNLWALIIVHGLIDTLSVVIFYLNGVPQAIG